MDVVKVAFAVLGHLLASVIYVWRRIPISSSASVDRPSVLENRDQIKELWENRMMANEQPLSAEIISDTNDGKGFADISNKLPENGNCVLLQEETETEKENTTVIKGKPENSEVVNEQENEEVDDSEQHEGHVEFLTTEVKYTDLSLQTGKMENDTGLGKHISHAELNHSDAEGETEAENEINAELSVETIGRSETLEFSGFSADIKETSEVEQYFKAVATCTLSECNKYTKISEVEFEDSSHLDCNDSLQDASETQEKDSLEVSMDSDYGEHSEHEENYLHEEIYSHITGNHEVSEVETSNTQDFADVSYEDSCEQHFDIDGEHVKKYIENQTVKKGEITEKDFCSDFPQVIDDLNNTDQPHSVKQTEEPNTEKNEKRNGKGRPSTLGVQKTEQPYNTCTTETKIAMEIREMREREEELKLMREKLMSPVEGSPSPKSLQIQNTDSQRSTPGSNTISPEPMVPGPGYRVSSVFGHKGAQTHQQEEDKQLHRSFNKESSVEKEIRLARSREEELRREKGLPPREDDSYVKPSQVKSSQVRVFSKVNPSNSTKEMATAKIQLEIEEQTMREMTLRDTGRIQTISQERTDSKVAKLKDLDIYIQDRNSPTLMAPTPGNGALSVTERNGNGTFSDHSSKRSTPSPTGSSQGIMAPVSKPPSQGKGVSMQRFIASRGKETTFSAPRNGPLHPQSEPADASRSNVARKPAKRVASVESKIQREILEMKLREEELRRLHSAAEQSFLTPGENGTDQEVLTTSPLEYENSSVGSENDETCPSHNILIAKWEQRIQKSEGKA